MILNIILLLIASGFIVYQNVTISSIENYNEISKWVIVLLSALVTAIFQWRVFSTSVNNLTMFLLLSLVCTIVLSFLNGVFILGESFTIYNIVGLIFIILGGILLKM